MCTRSGRRCATLLAFESGGSNPQADAGSSQSCLADDGSETGPLGFAPAYKSFFKWAQAGPLRRTGLRMALNGHPGLGLGVGAEVGLAWG